jgi:hypothetical protein
MHGDRFREDLKFDVGVEPKMPLKERVGRWVEWYRGYRCDD